MKEACKKLIAFHEKEISFSKKVEDDSTAWGYMGIWIEYDFYFKLKLIW